MKGLKLNTNAKQSVIDSLYFWGFWIILVGTIVGIVGGTLMGSLKSISAFIVPHILPVYLIGLLFDNLYIKKKVMLFFVLAIPFAYCSGSLINVWFNWIMKDSNVKMSNEIIIFVFAIIYIGFRYIKLAIAQRKVLNEAENKQALSELQYLRSQLNPHFLFNSLNSIYSLVLSKSDKAGEAVLALSELMRYHIDLSGKLEINLTEEIGLIERYIALEKLKLENRCDIKLAIQGNPKDCAIAPLLLMPLVENAFKYSITSNPSSNFVHLNIGIEDNNLLLEISNSIAKKTALEQKKGLKIGISNTLKRLELHYKGNYTFSNIEEKSIYKVSLSINLKK